MSGIRALLWDKDGTLLDTFSLWVELERTLAATLGARFLEVSRREEYTQQVLSAMGVDLDGRVSPTGVLASGTERDIWRVFYEALGSDRVSLNEFVREARHELRPLLRTRPAAKAMPGIREVLDAARSSGIPQGVATADTEANARRDLEAAGLDHFGFLASSDSPGVKPSAWPVLAFAAWAGVLPSEVLVIGDAPVDRAMATAAGASFVAVLWGTGREPDFAGAAMVDHPTRLKDFFESRLTM